MTEMAYPGWLPRPSAKLQSIWLSERARPSKVSPSRYYQSETFEWRRHFSTELENQAALIAEFAFLLAQAVFHLLWIRNVIGAKSKGVLRASGSLLRGPLVLLRERHGFVKEGCRQDGKSCISTPCSTLLLVSSCHLRQSKP